MLKNKMWFEDWFDSKYYHLLYKERNINEAKDFIKRLFDTLKPNPSSKLIDIACGKGRHAIQMANYGFEVDAFDLSKSSIASAKQFETDKLKFYVNDIRTPLNHMKYDYGFNLFTSFGYFDQEQEDLKAIQAIYDSLNVEGVFILDYMNVASVIPNLVASEVKEIEGVQFFLKRFVKEGYIIKEINFSDQGIDYQFFEKVRVIDLPQFLTMFSEAGFKVMDIFGDYNLSKFDKKVSQRVIISAKKI